MAGKRRSGSRYITDLAVSKSSQWNTTQVILWDITDTFGTNYAIKCGLFHSLCDMHLSLSVRRYVSFDNPAVRMNRE